jgi:hypothetical protein
MVKRYERSTGGKYKRSQLALGTFSQLRSQSEVILLVDRRDFLYLGAATRLATVLSSPAGWSADASPDWKMGLP